MVGRDHVEQGAESRAGDPAEQDELDEAEQNGRRQVEADRPQGEAGQVRQRQEQECADDSDARVNTTGEEQRDDESDGGDDTAENAQETRQLGLIREPGGDLQIERI
jgi:hypothetical protein